MEVLNNENNSPGRPTLLTVICILTFIGSGWGIVDSVLDYSSADLAGSIASEAIAEVQEKIDEEEEVPAFVSSIFGSMSEGLTPANIRKLGVMELVSNVLTLIGGIMMWGLRKTGFWLYCGGITFLVIAPLIIFNKGIIGIAASGITGFFGVIFIVLYAINLKHMK